MNYLGIITNVVLLSANVLCMDDEYRSKGCYSDQAVSAITGGYQVIENDTVEKCFRVAEGKGFDVFAVENHNRCYTSRDAYRTYWKYGPSEHCNGGRGGVLAMDVYVLRPTSAFMLAKMHAMEDEIQSGKNEIEKLRNSLATKQEDIDSLKKLVKTAQGSIESQMTGINTRIQTEEKRSESTRKDMSDIQCSVEQNVKNIARLNFTIAHIQSPVTSIPLTSISKTVRITTAPPSQPPHTITLTSTLTPTQSYWIYYPQNTTEHKVKRNLYGFSFLAYGYSQSARKSMGINLSVKECAWRCSKEHEYDPSFDGFSYTKGLGLVFHTCFCQQNDSDNVSADESLHFRWL